MSGLLPMQYPRFPAKPAPPAFALQAAQIELPKSDNVGVGLTSGLGHTKDEVAGSDAG